jgi:hypothetical protein
MKRWAQDKGYLKSLKAKSWNVQRFTPHIRPAVESMREVVINEKLFRALRNAIGRAELNKVMKVQEVI